ncbi:MAG: SufD family Fe-S cluster assembly protein, partial [Pseudomonadota bacterium]
DSKPELEIYADDVVCGHGSTCAEIDPDLVFYLRARGIPEDTARALLMESFVGEAIEQIEDDAVADAVMKIAADWLAARAV